MSAEFSEIVNPELENEMREIALEYFRELWENTQADGLDPMIVAETVMEATLNEISGMQGDEEPRRMLSNLINKDEHGAFAAFRTLQ